MALTKVIPGMIDGSVSGGATNLITDGDAESGVVTNYIEGSYAAATRPAGTFTASSGAGTFAISNSSTTPLFGTRSFILTKSSGASRQGRAIERTIQIDSGYQASVMDVFFQYKVDSGTFVAGSTGASATDSSMIVYTALSPDGTTWTIKEPTSFRLLSNSTTIVDTMVGNIQTNADTTHVKFIMYVAETANSAWSLKCELGVRPTNYVYGTPITDWQSYTPTGSWTGLVTYTGRKRRAGDKGEYQVFVSLGGAPTGTTFLINQPSGENIDATKLVGGTDANLGYGSILDSGSYYGITTALYSSATQVQLRATSIANPHSLGQVTNTNPVTWASGDSISISYFAPVVGWSSSVQMSDNGGETRVVAARLNGATATSFAVAATVSFSASATFDTHGMYNGSNTLTVQVPGFYRISAGALTQSFTQGTTGAFQIYYRINSGTDVRLGWAIGNGAAGAAYFAGGDDLVRLNAGDTVQFRVTSSSTASLSEGYASLERVTGPSAIAASETVAASASRTSTDQTIAVGAGTFRYFTALLNSKDVDTHSAMTASGSDTYYDIPTSGLYEVEFLTRIGHSTTATFVQLLIQLNGTLLTDAAALTGTTLNGGAVLNSTDSDGRSMITKALRRFNAGDRLRPTVLRYGNNQIFVSNSFSSFIVKRIGL